MSDGAEVKLWDVASGREQHSLSGHQWWVECVAFSPDSRFLVSAGGFEKNPGEVRVWDLASHGSEYRPSCLGLDPIVTAIAIKRGGGFGVRRTSPKGESWAEFCSS